MNEIAQWIAIVVLFAMAHELTDNVTQLAKSITSLRWSDE